MRNDAIPRSLRKASAWRLLVIWTVSLVAFAVFVTCVVLLSAIQIFGIDHSKVIDAALFHSSYNQSAKIPKIVHQTWKTGLVPERWAAVRQNCMQIMPDFEFKLWTDTMSREFIASEYPWFLSTWDSYPYNIQRADAIRYFILYTYGGIYMDLDIGCRAHPGALLAYDTILPITKPIGVSNDLMFSVSGTPFMEMVMQELPHWNRNWFFMPYATVMFSTGPMFLSAMAARWNRMLATHSEHSDTVRIDLLPKSLYGKNVAVEDAPYAFFRHYYGSSWHASDASFVDFLGKQIYRMLFLAVLVVLVALVTLRHTRSRTDKAHSARDVDATPLISAKHKLDIKHDSNDVAHASLSHNAPSNPDPLQLSKLLRFISQKASSPDVPLSTRLQSLRGNDSQSQRPKHTRQRTRDAERNLTEVPAEAVKPVLHRAWSSESVLSDRSPYATRNVSRQDVGGSDAPVLSSCTAQARSDASSVAKITADASNVSDLPPAKTLPDESPRQQRYHPTNRFDR